MTLSCWPKSSSGHCWSTATSRYVVLPNWSDFSPLLWSGNKLKPLSKQGFTLGCTTCPRRFWFLNASGLQLEYTSKLKIQLCRMPALAKQIFAALYKLRLSLLQDEEWDLLCVDIYFNVKTEHKLENYGICHNFLLLATTACTDSWG